MLRASGEMLLSPQVSNNPSIQKTSASQDLALVTLSLAVQLKRHTHMQLTFEAERVKGSCPY